MTKRLSAAQQRNGVSEGFAFGLYVLGRHEFDMDKLRIDFAFERAWNDWPEVYRSQYPQVSTDLRQGSDPIWKLLHANYRSQVFAFYWEWQGPGPIRIVPRQRDWRADDPADLEFAVGVISGDVPVEGWTSLASVFLSDYDRP